MFLIIAVAVLALQLAMTPSEAAADPVEYERYGLYGVGHPAGEHLVGNTPGYQDLVYRRIAEAGGTSTRIALSWREIEAEKGKYDWSDIDGHLAQLEKYQIRPYLLVVNTPGWARLDGQPTHFAPAPEFLPDFKRFCRDAAKRFKGRVRHYEVWNEQNGFGWEVPPFNQVDKYLPVLEAAYDGLKEGDPGCMVSLGGLDNAAGNSPIFTKGSYELRLRDYGNRRLWDAFADHPYGDRESMMVKERVIKGIAAGYGDGDLELWLTEYGFRVDDEGEMGQAEKLTEFMTTLIEDPEFRYVTETNYLCVADFDSSKAFGLCDANLRPRESFYAYQRLPRPGQIVIHDIRWRPLSGDAFEVTWQTSEPAESDAVLGSAKGSPEERRQKSTNHLRVFRGLKPGTQYSFQIVAKAEGFPESRSLDYPFHTPKAAELHNGGFEQEFLAGIAPHWDIRGDSLAFDSANERLGDRRKARTGHAQVLVAVGRWGDRLDDYAVSQAAAEPGRSYSFSAWTSVYPGDGQDEVHCQVGLDPTGGTDPAASSVVWSEPGLQNEEWQQASVEATAVGRVVSAFVRVKSSEKGEDDQFFYLDDAVLTAR